MYYDETQNATQSATQTKKYEKIREKVLVFCEEPKTSEEIRKYFGIEDKSILSRQIIKPLIREEKLDYTNKNSVNAKNQKYVAIKTTGN